MEKSQREELGKFLKSRRTRIKPSDVGVIPYGKRRSPGLKREEVAQLAGVSMTWYTWMEQGRDINFSVDVLNSVLHTLHLQEHEKRYVFELCGLQFSLSSSQETLSDFLRQLVDHQGDYPAYILDRYWHVMYMNQSGYDLFWGFDQLPKERQNIIWYTFTRPEVQSLVDEWDNRARRIIAEFRADCKDMLDDPWLIKFISELRHESTDFDTWWDQHDVQFREESEKIFIHPTKGRLIFHQHTFKPTSALDLKLTIQIPVQNAF